MNAPADTPNTRCAQLADFLAEMARAELTPVIRQMLPEARKAAVRAYWMGCIAEYGGIGKTVAKAIQPQQEAA